MRRFGWALFTVLALMLAGCTIIPTQGPVAEGNVDLTESNPLYLQVYGPVADSTPEQIVQGFLTAQAGGASDNFETARKFLSGQARKLWNPNDQTTVFSGDASLRTLPAEIQIAGPPTGRRNETNPSSAPAEDQGRPAAGTETSASDAGDPADEPDPTASEDLTVPPAVVTLGGRLSISGTLDAAGRYTEATAEASQDVTFTLEQDAAQQWRIIKTGDGALIQEPNFAAAYRSANVYFVSPDQKYLVPETRWFPQRNIATYVTRALLSGPSPWLRDSVLTAFPMGTRLAIEAVITDDTGNARVELTSTALDAQPRDRALLVAQLEATLMRLPGISSVEVLSGGSPLSVTETVDTIRDPLPMVLPRGVRDGKMVQLNGYTITDIATTTDLGNREVTGIGFADAGWPVVIRTGTTDLEIVANVDAASTPFMSGENILAPSVDRFGWVWSGSDDVDGALRALTPGGKESAVGADWLEGQKLISARVSRDGARVAVISERAGIVQIDVAGIIRDASNAPQGLSIRTPVGASIIAAKELVWVDEVTLAVLGASSEVSPTTVHVVPVGAHSFALTAVDGAVSVAAGRGERTLYVRTKSDDLWSSSSTGTNWSLVASDVEVFSFPG